MRASIIVLCLMVCVSVLLWARPASACSCASHSAFPEVETADAGFTGKVVEVDVPVVLREGVVKTLPEPCLRTAFVFTDPTVRVRFEVERWYTTPRGRFVALDAGSGLCCDCSLGASFVVGGRYLVGAYESEGVLHGSSCNRPLHEADAPERFAERLELLGPGRAPAVATGDPPMSRAAVLSLLLGALALVVAIPFTPSLLASFAAKPSVRSLWRRIRYRADHRA